MAPNTRSSLKRARSPSLGRSTEPSSSRRRLGPASTNADIVPRGDVVLVFEDVIASETPDNLFVGVTKRLRVSSGHLTLKSRVFRAMLDGYGFAETARLRHHGEIELMFNDREDDFEAFEIIMNALHAHHRRVPEVVCLRTFASIATVVDKYELHEVVEPFIEGWMMAIYQSFPLTMDIYVLPWLWISWVFRLNFEFTKLTQLAERQGTALTVLYTEEYPLPASITYAINRRRETALWTVKHAFDALAPKVGTEAKGASWNEITEQSRLYGLYRIQRRRLGLTSTGDFLDRSFVSIAEGIRNMVDTPDIRFRKAGDPTHMTFSLSIKNVLLNSVEECESQLKVLSFDSLKSEPTYVDVTADDGRAAFPTPESDEVPDYSDEELVQGPGANEISDSDEELEFSPEG